MIRRTFIGAVLAAAVTATAQAEKQNFADSKAIELNICPHVKLSDFVFFNRFSERRSRFETSLNWTNTGSQPVVAFEVVILKYDAFDQRMVGTRWVITGRNSADWSPLKPGDSSTDGTISQQTEDVYTAIVYVRQARLADGTVWRAQEPDVLAAVKKLAPGLKEPGSVRPDTKSST